jgi:hypothetical protein
MKGDATLVQLILLVFIVWMIAGLVGIICWWGSSGWSFVTALRTTITPPKTG